jgi:hypothetical protein
MRLHDEGVTVTDHQIDGTGHGKRRIDRVLAANYLAGLTSMPMDRLRALRADAEQEEVDLSYIRRLVQARIDILEAELARRQNPEGTSLLGDLPQILADERGAAFGSGRHSVVTPSRVDVYRRRVELLVAESGVAEVAERSDEEIDATLQVLQTEERRISDQRKSVQGVVDALTAELTRRYRDGEANVSDLLPSES